MANMVQTLGKRISARTALFMSVAFILLRWSTKAVTNVYYVDTVLNRVGSMQGLSLSALANGISTVLSVTLLLCLSRETYRDLGFHRRHLLKQLGLGILFGVLIFILDTFVIGLVVDALLPKMPAEGIDMCTLFNNIAYLPIWIMIALLKGGFSEELWRTFTLTRFEKCFGKTGLVFCSDSEFDRVRARAFISRCWGYDCKLSRRIVLRSSIPEKEISLGGCVCSRHF